MLEHKRQDTIRLTGTDKRGTYMQESWGTGQPNQAGVHPKQGQEVTPPASVIIFNG